MSKKKQSPKYIRILESDWYLERMRERMIGRQEAREEIQMQLRGLLGFDETKVVDLIRRDD